MPKRKSKQHNKVLEILRQIFNTKIEEEYQVKNGKTYLVDIYVPQLNIAFEIQGEQHEKYIPFFHANKQKFSRQIKRDNEKAIACEVNGIRLIYIYPKDKIDVDFILGKIGEV